MDIAALEDELVALLIAEFTPPDSQPDSNIIVVPLPENTMEFKRPPVGGIRITVGYNESDHKELLTTKPIAQPEEITLVISLQSRTLRDSYGIYTFKNKCENALLGYTPANCDHPIYSVYFGAPGPGMDVLTDDVWCYVWHIKTRSVLAQKRDASDPVVVPSYSADSLIIHS